MLWIIYCIVISSVIGYIFIKLRNEDTYGNR